MLSNKKQWYILGGLLFVLAAILIGKIIEGWENNRNPEIHAAVLIKKDSEQEYSELMSGIRDYARENGVLVHVNYMDDPKEPDLLRVLWEEKELGSAAALFVCPEEFYEDGDVKEIHGELPFLVVSKEQIKSEYRLTEEALLQLMEGKLDKLVVVNEYHLGYSAMEALTNAAGQEKIGDIQTEYLELTAEDLSSGKYNALLSDR